MTKEELFHRNKKVINRFVRSFLSKNKVGVVHGARGQNAQLPRFLERKSTRDWDVFVKDPKLRALQVESLLDKRFRGNFFRVKEGITKKLKVHKVISNINNESYVDFSIPDRLVPVKSIRGVKFATLKDQFNKAKQNVVKPELEFRRKKDLDFIRRVKIFEKQRGKKL